MNINKVSQLTGVTIRTLQYYDKINLLKPSRTKESNYRQYTKKDLELLQQILFYKELDYTLTEIKEIIYNPNFDIQVSLQNQKKLLQLKQSRLTRLINSIDNTLKGENNMSFNQFNTEDIDKYKDEVKEKYENTEAYKEFQQKTSNYSTNDWSNIKNETSEILKKFSNINNLSPDSEEAKKLVEQWKNYISTNFYECTNDILLSLADMYISDERFKINLDKYGEDTATFMSNAIKQYCQK